MHRSGPVEGLVTETPGNIGALCSCLEHLVPDLRGRVHPSLCLQRLSTELDPEPPVEVSDNTRDMFPRLRNGSRRRRPGAAAPSYWPCPLQPHPCGPSDARCPARWCPAASAGKAFSPSRCPSRSSGAASSTRSSSSTAIASCSWKQPARTTSQPLNLGLGFLRRLGEINRSWPCAPSFSASASKLPQRVRLGSRDRHWRGLHLRPRDLGNPAHMRSDGHRGLVDVEARSDHVRPHSGVLLGAEHVIEFPRRSWRDSR